MQVNDHLQSVLPRPSNGLLEIRQLAGDVGLPRAHLEGPVADRDADMVETGVNDASMYCMESRPRDSPSRRNVSEVLLGDPSIPVLLEDGERGLPVLELTEGVLVDNGRVASVVEEAWRDPWLGEASVSEERKER